MDATKTPDTNDNTELSTQDTTTPETPSCAAITKNVFESSECSWKHRPSLPVKEDNPAAKKASNSDNSPTFLQAFLQALKECGTNRTKLMRKVDGEFLCHEIALSTTSTWGYYRR